MISFYLDSESQQPIPFRKWWLWGIHSQFRDLELGDIQLNAVVLLSCCFAAACEKGDGWKEYKYRSDGFAISAPSEPIQLPPSDEHPNTRAYSINYGNRTEVSVAAGTLGMWENLSDRENLQRLKDLEVRGTSSKLISDKEISLEGNPGIEYEIEGTVLHSRSRWYMVNGKVVALQSSAPVGAPFAVDTDRIFDSLRLLK